MAKAVLKVFDTPLSICSLRAGAPLPNWIKGDFICVVKTGRELSVVCEQDAVPRGVQVQDGFVRVSVCQVEGEPFTGLLNRMAHALEEEKHPASGGIFLFNRPCAHPPGGYYPRSGGAGKRGFYSGGVNRRLCCGFWAYGLSLLRRIPFAV